MPSISFSIYEGVRRVLALNCPAISVMIVISTFQLHAMTELTLSLKVLRGQRIKLIQAVSNSTLHEYGRTLFF